jgi:hypothetical protein
MEQHESDLRADLREQPDTNLDTPPKVENISAAQSSGTPQETNALAKFASSPGTFAEYPKSSAVWQLYETGIRGNAMVLLFSIVHGIEAELRDVKDELKSLRQSYHDECLKTARLEGELSSERKLKKLQNMFLIFGGLLNSLAVKLYYDEQKSIGLLMFVIGLAMILVGLLWQRGANSKQ